MEWSEDAIILGTRRHGESSLVLETMTRSHGRYLGIVKGGRSRRFAATLQPGNTLAVTWRARLDEHLGNFQIEPLRLRAAELMQTAIGLNALQTLAAHLRLLPERDPHAELYDALHEILDQLSDAHLAAEFVIRFELMILQALGFGLDLSRCAVTGETRNLVWVSPRTGRAATREAGDPYAGGLLALPSFLRPDAGGGGNVPPAHELADGMRLTGHFLARWVWHPRGIEPPSTRDALVAAIAKLARDTTGPMETDRTS